MMGEREPVLKSSGINYKKYNLFYLALVIFITITIVYSYYPRKIQSLLSNDFKRDEITSLNVWIPSKSINNNITIDDAHEIDRILDIILNLKCRKSSRRIHNVIGFSPYKFKCKNLYIVFQNNEYINLKINNQFEKFKIISKDFNIEDLMKSIEEFSDKNKM